MTAPPGRLRCGRAALGVLLLVPAAPAVAVALQNCPGENSAWMAYPRFFSPLELGQGALYLDAPGPDAYAASLRWHLATLGVDSRSRLRVGATVAAQYLSPELELMGGGRVLWQPPFARWVEVGGTSLGLSLAAEGLLGTDRRRTVGGAAVVDIFGVLQASARIARELRDDQTLFELSVGTDLAHWRRPPARRPRRTAPDPFEGLTGFLRIVAADVRVQVDALCADGLEAERRSASDGTLLRLAGGQPHSAGLDSLLRARGDTLLAAALVLGLTNATADAAAENELIPDLADPRAQRLVVGAILLGWRRALGLP